MFTKRTPRQIDLLRDAPQSCVSQWQVDQVSSLRVQARAVFGGYGFVDPRHEEMHRLLHGLHDCVVHVDGEACDWQNSMLAKRKAERKACR